ncbi:Spo11/DNA topoisomerase VI subunit A [Fusarium acuminatum]|uniref:DNA topoisomerase (ATP-hydrolyzing) n=1 Tax=Fusarium acuminatum TaxID=5515 RepID=A0ABZ2WYZ6_9HYPO
MDEDENLAHENATPELTDRGVNLASEAPGNERADTNTISNASVGSVVARIENTLMHIVDALRMGEELTLVHTSRRSRRSTSAQPEMIHYPGRNLQESVKFARILVILQLSHDALVSGTVLTKRHIFYQHQNLFDKQSQVDDLVDDIAFNMGVSRGNLNIVAASKGVLAGPLTIRLNDGSALGPCSGDMVLVVEKDAVFRSLCSSQFWRTSLSGPGVLITAKGYPDLTTRAFLSFIQMRHPQLPILGLFDYDPDGVKILQCYRYGSERLSHETGISTQTLQWLGIKSNHLFRDYTGALPISPDPVTQSSRVSMTSTSCRDPVSYLSARERAAAISILKKMERLSVNDVEASEMRREVQLMLTLGVKAEIEWLDESGDLCSWLDGEIGEALISDSA